MGLLERWDERNQRTAEWQQEVGRRNPHPPIGRTVRVGLLVLVIFELIGALVGPAIGNIAWIAVLFAIAVAGGVILYRQIKRQRREWESTRS